MNDGRKYHAHIHREKSPWRVAFEGVVIVVLVVAVFIAMTATQ